MENLIKTIEKYEDSYNLDGLDKIAEKHLKQALKEDEFEALIQAYLYIYEQLAMDYASRKYWRLGNESSERDRLGHLELMIDCLTWPQKIFDDTYFNTQHAINLAEKAILINEVGKKKELFVLAEQTIDELLENEPENIKYKLQKLELLIDSYEHKVNEVKAMETVLELLGEISQKIDSSNYDKICGAMMYSRRLENYSELKSLMRINEEFDLNSQSLWLSDSNSLIDWCSHYIYVFYHHISTYHFNNWFAVAKKIPERLNGCEKELSNLSYDIYSLTGTLEENNFIAETEKCYLLSLAIEKLIYSNDKHKGMAWRKLSFAKNQIDFYLSHNRKDEAVYVIREHIDYGTQTINNGFEDSGMHSQLRDLWIWLLDLVDEERRAENYETIILHCQRRIGLLKEQISDYQKVGDKKLWSYLFYLYKEDYVEQIRYNLLLNNKEEAIKVLNNWFEYLSQFNDVYPDSQGNFSHIRTLRQDKDFAPVYEEIDTLLSK